MTALLSSKSRAWHAGCRQPAGRRTDGANSGIRRRTADASNNAYNWPYATTGV